MTRPIDSLNTLSSGTDIYRNNGTNFTDAIDMKDAVNLGLIHMESAHYLRDKLWLTIIFGICLSSTSFCGVLGNILIMLSVGTDKFLRQPGNVFIINLALADFLVALIVDPFNVVGAVYGAKFFNDHHWLCIIVGVVCTPSCVTSLYTIMAIGVNRYIRICKYQYYHRIYTWRTSIIMCVGVWFCGLMIHFPNHVGWGKTGYDADFYVCAFSIHTYSYALFWLGCSVVIPSVVISFCYVRIFSHFKAARAAVASHRGAAVKDESPLTLQPSPISPTVVTTLTSSKQGSDDPKTSSSVKALTPLMRNAASKEEDERKLLRSLFLVLVAFLVCWIPFVVLVAAGSPRWVPGWVYVITVIMAHGNSTVNVFIYGFTNRNFRLAYKRLICCDAWRSKRQRKNANRVGAASVDVNVHSTFGAQSRKTNGTQAAESHENSARLPVNSAI